MRPVKKEKNVSEVKLSKRIKQYFWIYVLILPSLAYLLINNYIPMAGIVVAFKNFRYDLGIFGSEWNGFKNFEYLFTTKEAWVITRNTICYNLVFIILGTAAAVLVAILLNEIRSKRAKKAYQTLILMPYLISMVIIAFIVYGFLSPGQGFINQVLAAFGKNGADWYSQPKYWPFILVFVNLWNTVGYTCIIYLATLVGIDPGYYEAASIDGASFWKKTIHITLPMMKSTIIVMVLLAVGRIFYSDFGLFYQVPMDVGALYDVTNTIDTYVFRGLIQNPNIGMSGAANVYQSIVGFVLVICVNGIVRKVSRDNALF